MLKKNVGFLFVAGILSAQTIRFAPLPMDNSIKLYKEYEGFIKYIERETKIKIKLVVAKSYKELIDKFSKKKIDIAEFGALPYLKLKNRYSYAKPFLTSLSKSGKTFYTCNFFTTDKNINTLKDIDKNTTIFLTNSRSTCGYLMSEDMLKMYNLSLKNLKYRYKKTHSNVVLYTVMNENSIGDVKSSIYKKYRYLKLKLLKKSTKIPSFSLIANTKSLKQDDIEKISKVLLKLNPSTNKKDRIVMKNWGKNIKYGFIKTPSNMYQKINKIKKEIKIP